MNELFGSAFDGNSFADQVQAYRRRYGRLKRSQEAVLRLRQALEYEQQATTDKVRFVRESQQQLEDERSIAVSPKRGIDGSEQTTSAAFELAKTDLDELEEHIQKVRRHAAKLNSLEFVMHNREEEYTSAIDALELTLSDAGIVPQLASSVHTEGASSERSSVYHLSVSEGSLAGDVHPALSGYYDKVGDFKVTLDRLHQLEIDQDAERVTRTMLLDQDQLPVVDDETFELHCQQELDLAHRALDNAISASEKAHSECKALGLEPEIHALHSQHADYAAGALPMVLDLGRSPISLGSVEADANTREGSTARAHSESQSCSTGDLHISRTQRNIQSYQTVTAWMDHEGSYEPVEQQVTS